MESDFRKKINQYGKDIDHLIASNDYEHLDKLLSEIKQFADIDDEAKKDVLLFYYLGTGYGEYSDYLLRCKKSSIDASVVEARRWSFFFFRKALKNYSQKEECDKQVLLPILTNYANGLDTVGRTIQALQLYRIALSYNPSFSMALGNYGRTLQFLASMVNDPGHYNELHFHAYHAIKAAISLNDPNLYDQAREAFQSIISNYENGPLKKAIRKSIHHKKYSLGKEDEKAYRTWCLNNHLFLTPLNEIMKTESAFAHDPLTIATFSEDIHHSDSVSGNPAEPPRWFAMLNQLKEEYIYARYMFYEGSYSNGDLHYADKETHLTLATYDYCIYSIRIEQLKTAFKILYSMFDQICFFVNDFWKIGIEERRVSAKSIYKAKNYPEDNIPLLSLKWLLSEFFETYGDEISASEEDISILRNAMEHKFVKIHEHEWNRPLQFEQDSFYHISEELLIRHTLRLLELAREALMYLVYAVGVNENKKAKQCATVQMQLSDFQDDWKL